MASVAAMKATIEKEREAHPDHWRDRGRAREYADLQARVFYAAFEKQYGERAFKAAKKRRYRSSDRKAWEEACRTFQAAEVKAVLSFLSDGVLDQRVFKGRMQHLSKFDRDKMKAVSLEFWQEVAEVLGVELHLRSPVPGATSK